MEFNEIKKNILENETDIQSLCPNYPLYKTLESMIDYLEIAINKDKEPLAPGIPEDVSRALEQLTESTLRLSYTKKERDYLEQIGLIYNNFNTLYPAAIVFPFLIDILFLFISTSRTLEESIYLNTYLLSKMKSWFQEENLTTTLSKKYYSEYQDFLKENKNYSIGLL